MPDTEKTFSQATSWGSRITDKGAAFRLWAPNVTSIDLVAERDGERRFLTMAKIDGGWWEIETDAVMVGEGYGFRVNGGLVVPDPAARAQMSDVHGLSRLVDPRAFEWQSADWKGRPWHETVFYELHTGTFTPEGTFDAIIEKLEYLKGVGITAIELLPVAQYGGQRGWGYDGVLLYAPHEVYGGAEGLKRLVDAAHQHGLMVFLDVVYNHFGPDGNYIGAYAPEFFHPEIHTAWGAAIAYDEAAVREFMIENALYWLTEYRLDGLRLDAIDSIQDTTDVPIIRELAARIREKITDRPVHITSEDARNITWHIERDPKGQPLLISGEWNDDFHHCAHVLATHEDESYYSDYSRNSVKQIARSLAEGFVYQGEHSRHRDEDVGFPSGHLPPTAFVNFIQNHDQIGNRAFGDRLKFLSSVRAYTCLESILLLSPQIPLMFQGDEFGDTTPFCYFTDFSGELGSAVSQGRKAEFSSFSAFEDPQAAEIFPDPNDESTFLVSKLDWALLRMPTHKRCLQVTRNLLRVRRDVLMPLLADIPGGGGSAMVDERKFAVSWTLADGREYQVFANLTDETWDLGDVVSKDHLATVEPVYSNHLHAPDEMKEGRLSAYTTIFLLAPQRLFTPNL